ncbi:hypothetical protein DFH09DRAFT_1080868 [Mycena vulgaris]|nr:hypothetical protein DFH09DRAFT_1080868 [Mycena vulgaris]
MDHPSQALGARVDFELIARNVASHPNPSSNRGQMDGHPDPIYEPATGQNPSLFPLERVLDVHYLWQNESVPGLLTPLRQDRTRRIKSTRSNLILAFELPQTAQPSSLTNSLFTVWSRDRHILDNCVLAAGDFYVNTQALPRKTSWSITSARNRAQGWGTRNGDSIYYKPASDALQAKTVTKSHRALSSLIFPADIKEILLADAKEFLASKLDIHACSDHSAP